MAEYTSRTPEEGAFGGTTVSRHGSGYGYGELPVEGEDTGERGGERAITREKIESYLLYGPPSATQEDAIKAIQGGYMEGHQPRLEALGARGGQFPKFWVASEGETVEDVAAKLGIDAQDIIDAHASSFSPGEGAFGGLGSNPVWGDPESRQARATTKEVDYEGFMQTRPAFSEFMEAPAGAGAYEPVRMTSRPMQKGEVLDLRRFLGEVSSIEGREYVQTKETGPAYSTQAQPSERSAGAPARSRPSPPAPETTLPGPGRFSTREETI